jgi:hypothetical protein
MPTEKELIITAVLCRVSYVVVICVLAALYWQAVRLADWIKERNKPPP